MRASARVRATVAASSRLGMSGSTHATDGGAAMPEEEGGRSADLRATHQKTHLLSTSHTTWLGVGVGIGVGVGVGIGIGVGVGFGVPP